MLDHSDHLEAVRLNLCCFFSLAFDDNTIDTKLLQGLESLLAADVRPVRIFPWLSFIVYFRR